MLPQGWAALQAPTPRPRGMISECGPLATSRSSEMQSNPCRAKDTVVPSLTGPLLSPPPDVSIVLRLSGTKNSFIRVERKKSKPVESDSLILQQAYSLDASNKA